MNETGAYAELSAYTLSLRDAEFVHQHVVDTFTAQHAGASTKPIAITFALVGLFLHLERGFTGKEVQRAHMKLAQRRQTWPPFELPADRGSVTAADVLAANDRRKAIDEWCASVWDCYRDSSATLARLLEENGIID